MNIIFFTKRHGKAVRIDLTQPTGLLLTGALLTALCAGLLYGGYRLGAAGIGAGDGTASGWQKQLHQQQAELERAKRTAQANLNALAMRLGQIQAHVIRLDALGRRLAQMANLNKREFNFDQPPGEGGVENPSDLQQQNVPNFLQELDQLSRQVKLQEQMLGVLETALLNKRLRQQIVPAGRPVKDSWISSGYGYRIDPFTGLRAFHPGIDFAAPFGAPVHAVAAGVVVWSGPMDGFGNAVEINNGNGYSTLYGHNSKTLVKVGQIVRKGQLIARVGSTGRSTGPHVHFEVMYHGKPINPRRFVMATR